MELGVCSERANKEAPLRLRVSNLPITSYLEADLVTLPDLAVEVFFLCTGCFFTGFLEEPVTAAGAEVP